MRTHSQSWNEEIAGEIVGRHAQHEGALLPILHDVQQAFGYIPDAAIPLIASALNLSRAEVHGAVSFYHDFRTHRPQRPVVKLCRAEACQARGVGAIVAESSGRQDVDIEPIYCLGLCASGPAAMVGERVYARLDSASFNRLLDEVSA